MNHALAPVNDQQSASIMRNFGNFGHRENRTKHVGHMRDRNDAGPLGDHIRQMTHHEGAVGFQRKGTHRCAGLFGNQLPRHDIGVMIGNADQDFVTRLQIWFGPAARNQVQRHRCTRGQNNLVTGCGTDEIGHLAAHRLIEIG